jgi:hypothetical protein
MEGLTVSSGRLIENVRVSRRTCRRAPTEFPCFARFLVAWILLVSPHGLETLPSPSVRLGHYVKLVLFDWEIPFSAGRAIVKDISTKGSASAVACISMKRPCLYDYIMSTSACSLLYSSRPPHPTITLHSRSKRVVER